MTKTLIKTLRNLLTVSAVGFLSIGGSNAQTIQGPMAVNIGPSYTYTYDLGFTTTFTVTWPIAMGTIIDQPPPNGTIYSVTVQWNTAGTGTLSFKTSNDGILNTIHPTIT